MERKSHARKSGKNFRVVVLTGKGECAREKINALSNESAIS